MAVNVRAVGTVEASSTVEVRAQVAGELKTVGFKEGQDVTAGQLLFTIDPQPFEVALRQAEATLSRNEASLKNAEAQRTRAAELMKSGLLPRSEFDTATTAVATSAKPPTAPAITVRRLGLFMMSAPQIGWLPGGNLLIPESVISPYRRAARNLRLG